MRMDDDALAMAPGGALFQEERIRGLVPWGETAYLVVTRNGGMFRCRTRRRTEAAYRGPAYRGPAYRGPACSPFKPGSTELLASLQPYHATLLPAGRLAIGTLRGGVVLLDDSGRLLRILDETSGLRDETVRSTHVD
ncbi:MAG: hypothetical protein GY929_23415, partial [Actinomycetia bacterium]|nr:hypothetical protein [Actinomycetes bacterium]